MINYLHAVIVDENRSCSAHAFIVLDGCPYTRNGRYDDTVKVSVFVAGIIITGSLPFQALQIHGNLNGDMRQFNVTESFGVWCVRTVISRVPFVVQHWTKQLKHTAHEEESRAERKACKNWK
jgi:hypothetical protein